MERPFQPATGLSPQQGSFGCTAKCPRRIFQHLGMGSAKRLLARCRVNGLKSGPLNPQNSQKQKKQMMKTVVIIIIVTSSLRL